MQNANAAPADTDDAEDYLDFCNGEVGMLMGPGWKMGQITGEDGCPGKYDAVLGAFALPGSDGGVAPSFLGGSNLGISSQSENQGLALEFLKVLTSETYQTEFAEIGLIPVRKSLLGEVAGRRGGPGAGPGGRGHPVRPVQRVLGRRRGRQHPPGHGHRHLGRRRRSRTRPPGPNEAIVDILNGN